MSNPITSQALQQNLDAMRQRWRALRQAHERRALSPRAALFEEDDALFDLRDDLHDTMLSFAQGVLEWVERGHDIQWHVSTAPPQPSLSLRALGADIPAPQVIATQLDELLEQLVEPQALATSLDISEEMQRLEQWTSEEQLQVLEFWPDRARVLVIEHLAARARALQDLPTETLAFVDMGRITIMFGRMAEHLKQGWPGRAHGLARAHTPRGTSWAADTKEILEDFVQWRENAPFFDHDPPSGPPPARS